MLPYLNCFLVNCSGICNSINFSCSLDVDIEHVMSLSSFNCLRCSFIDSHCMSSQSILLLQFSIQQVNGWKGKQSRTSGFSAFADVDWTKVYVILTKLLTFGKLGRTAVQGLLKQISSSLKLLAPITIDELGEVSVPDIINIWPPE